jgi:Raf kinase inhibitor-like YbhB/YbcL family protein
MFPAFDAIGHREDDAMTILRFGAALAMTAAIGPAWGLEISSPAVGADNTIPQKYTANSFGCSGENVSLPLHWSGVPAEAKSLALTMYDPDAPTGSGFWHWLVVNMPPSAMELAEGAEPPAGAAQGRGDAGVAGYFGPCPPEGDTPHRYVFTIFAVDTEKLDVTAETSGAVVGFMLHFHTIDKASVTYTYGR